MTLNETFNRFIQNVSSNYAFIDPPWNYPLHRYKSDFWKDITIRDLLWNTNVDALFIYANLDVLSGIVSAYIESEYELRCIIPYVRLGRNDVGVASITHEFKNPVQYIVVLEKSTSQIIPTRLVRTSIIEDDNSFQKPIRWEESLFCEMSSRGFDGIYILPEGIVADINTEVKKEVVTRKELF